MPTIYLQGCSMLAGLLNAPFRRELGMRLTFLAPIPATSVFRASSTQNAERGLFINTAAALLLLICAYIAINGHTITARI